MQGEGTTETGRAALRFHKADRDQEPCKIRFDCGRARDRRLVQSFRETCGGGRLRISGPALAKLLDGDRCRARAKVRTSGEMTQQKRFMTGALPDQMHLRLRRDRPDPLIALRRLPAFVVIEQGEPMLIGFASLGLTLAEPLDRPFDDRQRVAPSRLQQDGVEMDDKAPSFGEARKQGDVALLALALTADEKPPALLYDATGSSHPICGTAP